MITPLKVQRLQSLNLGFKTIKQNRVLFQRSVSSIQPTRLYSVKTRPQEIPHRRQHRDPFVEEPFNASTLSVRIENFLETEQTVSATLEALKACLSLEEKIKQGTKDPEATSIITELISKITNSENTTITPKLIHDVFILMKSNPNLKNIETIIKAFDKKNRRRVIPKETAMVPFRHFVYNGDFKSAFKLIDLTTASSKYLKFKKAQYFRFVKYGIMGTGGLIALVDLILRSSIFFPAPTNIFGIDAMLAAYFANMGIIGSVAAGGKLAGNGSYIKWAPEAKQNYWYQHSDEMKMVAKIVEMDGKYFSFNGNDGGYCSIDVDNNVQQRLMLGVEPDSELELKEYWINGGYGFEWVEPDQDPAEILLRRNLENKRVRELNENDENSNKIADKIATMFELPDSDSSEETRR